MNISISRERQLTFPARCWSSEFQFLLEAYCGIRLELCLGWVQRRGHAVMRLPVWSLVWNYQSTAGNLVTQLVLWFFGLLTHARYPIGSRYFSLSGPTGLLTLTEARSQGRFANLLDMSTDPCWLWLQLFGIWPKAVGTDDMTKEW